ncbi:hypothetical protein SARC_01028 [Sphaeroforma arctica JP610]|uniref:CCZ1/INTU/HSP4 first Longin domain-containing protein n=1 Tax=Sphaeroforma arctica JP610 TaxID=667725 RepID=A0A0L0GCU4_9EUKA|nr:hypothetical protein SARC_01028 [Sphaeroforma arctica JP610]KNC86835.1 hypothetical protein SARC_01028 [Sphaeroforma arctica JP610]|eukprot:XP_014160737.1 hypothetical protein SARC_01028 [Sphaeroforma arctica JP610]
MALIHNEEGYWWGVSVLISEADQSIAESQNTLQTPAPDNDSPSPQVVECMSNARLRRFLTEGRDMFRLLHGNMDDLCARDGLPGLRAVLKSFYLTYVRNNALDDTSGTKCFGGVEILSLPSWLHMDCITMGSEIEAEFPDVYGLMIMSENTLLETSLPAEVTALIYDLLTSNQVGMPVTTANDNSRTWRYILGPSDLISSDAALNPLKLYVSADVRDDSYCEEDIKNAAEDSDVHSRRASTDDIEVYLVVLQKTHIRLALLIPEDLAFEYDFYIHLAAISEKFLDGLSAYTSKGSLAPPSTNSSSLMAGKDLLYYQDTMHVESTLPDLPPTTRSAARRRVAAGLVKSLRLFQDLFELLHVDKCNSEINEIMMMENEHWMVGRVDNNRIFLMSPKERVQTLTQVSAEVDDSILTRDKP